MVQLTGPIKHALFQRVYKLPTDTTEGQIYTKYALICVKGVNIIALGSVEETRRTP